VVFSTRKTAPKAVNWLWTPGTSLVVAYSAMLAKVALRGKGDVRLRLLSNLARVEPVCRRFEWPEVLDRAIEVAGGRLEVDDR